MSGKARNGCYLLAGWFTPPGELRGAQAGAVLGVGSLLRPEPALGHLKNVLRLRRRTKMRQGVSRLGVGPLPGVHLSPPEGKGTGVITGRRRQASGRRERSDRRVGARKREKSAR